MYGLNAVVRERAETAETLRLAYLQADERRREARRLQDLRALAARRDQIDVEQKKAQAEMRTAEEAWCAFVARLKAADAHVDAIRSNGACGQRLGAQLNDGFERMAGWLACRIVKDLPQMAPVVARALENSRAIAARPDKGAADVLPDFVAAWLATYGEKLSSAAISPVNATGRSLHPATSILYEARPVPAMGL